MKIPVIFLAFANDKVDNARYLRNLPLELDGIRKALKSAEKANLCEVVERANATIENILDTFQDERYRDRIAIFHYGGHADGYQLLLEQLDGSHAVAQGGGLVSFFSKQEGLKLVFFNGCSTHQQSVELMQAGIPAVIGTSNAINDDIATDLSIRFYKGIAQGMTLDRAWNAAIDEIKIKKGEANTRGLYRKEAATKMEDERFPWELLVREGSEIVKEFNLPSEVNNPLFGLPEIPQDDLPILPYQFLMRYDRSHAEVFFGRARYIRDLYNRITDKNSTSIISVVGQAGVGKSSLFDAGLVPRLEQSHVVKYIRRIQDKGLLGTLEDALGITRTEAEIQEDLAEAREASLNFEQKEVTHFDMKFLEDTSYGVNTNQLNTNSELPITNSQPETFEGQSVINTNLESHGEPSGIDNNQQLTTNQEPETRNEEQLTTNNQLIEQLKSLLNNVDANLQPSISKLIEELENKNIQNQVVVNPIDSIENCKSRLLKKWLQIEKESGKPLVIILDQVEEVYTRAMANLVDVSNENARINIGEHEIQTFLEEIKQVFDNPNKALLPKGKLLLGFRKEFQADFEEWFKYTQIPQNKVFIDVLNREEIIEVVQGLTTTERLKRNYRVSVETGLDEIIADDLLEDKDSAVAPILQLILTKLWKSCENDESKIFTTQKYQDFRREGLLMEDFVKDQFAKIREWNPELEQSGLVLDILMQHTTRFGTAGTKTIEELTKSYQYIRKPMLSILEKAKEMYLLVDLGQRTGLAHDAIAPVIIEKYTSSMYPGQRAMRLLKSKMPNFDPQQPKKKDNSVLDERELGVVMAGRNGMVMWDKDTTGKMIDESERRIGVNRRKRRWRRIGFVASIITIIAFAMYSQRQKMLAQIEQIRAEASQLLTLAVQNDDLTMALRLAERADSLATSVEDNTMKDKLIEIVATNSFYTYQWQNPLQASKICIDEDGDKFLFIDMDRKELILKTWNEEEIFVADAVYIQNFDLSPDGKKILTVIREDEEETVSIWDLNGNEVISLSGLIQEKGEFIGKVGFIPNSVGFYVFLNNKKVNFYDLKGRLTYQYEAKSPSEQIYDLVVSEGGEKIALYMNIISPNLSESRELRVVDTKAKETIFKKKQEEFINHLLFSPNGERVLWASDSTVNLIDNQGEMLTRWKFNEAKAIKDVCFSTDGAQIWTANDNKTVQMYDVQFAIDNYKRMTPEHILPFRIFEDDIFAEKILIRPKKPWLITISGVYGAKFWYLGHNYHISYSGVNDYPVNPSAVAFAPNGKQFYSYYLTGGGSLTSWQMSADSTHFETESTDFSEEGKEMRLQTNGKNILKVNDYQEMELIDSESRTLVKLPFYENYVDCFLSQDGEHILVSYNDTTQVFDKEGKSICTIKDAGDITVLSPDNQHLFITHTYPNENETEDNIATHLWDIKSKKLIQTLKGHTKPIAFATFAPDGKYLATASGDNTARIWNLQGQSIAVLRGHTAEVNAVAFSPTGNYVLTGAEDYTARLWDMNGNMLKTYTAHKVKSLAFAPNGQQFVSAGWQEYDQKDLFNISMNKKTVKILNNNVGSSLMSEKHTVSSFIVWNINQDQETFLKNNIFASNFSITNYLDAGAAINPQSFLDLENTQELNKAGTFFLESEDPISGLTYEKRLRYAEKIFEKSLEIERTKQAVIGITNVTELQKEPANLDWWDKVVGFFTFKKRKWGMFDVEEMLNAQSTEELEHYIEYINDKKLKKSTNESDSLKYWLGIKKLAKKSLGIKQTPYALSAFNQANQATDDVKENVKVAFNNNLQEMREFAKFFGNKNDLKKEDLLQSVEIWKHMFANMKATTDDYKYAAKIYAELAKMQLLDKEVAKAEESINRGLALDKDNEEVIIQQIVLLICTNRQEEAKKIFLEEQKNEAYRGETINPVNAQLDDLEKKGIAFDRKKLSSWLK